ncbi:mCpol domain-containing protein [Leptolyngbya sp. FACHB-17]|uniref:mCpol domain-containing protein n=1 Tax=unclassified Leptolyngbya TaxID=2650499 RepID=UPI001680DB1E|nr:mCpol domain-containing protein [Leptolyngbya sp. FACHB-17]MBD2082103.1 mCpol domain-containing protein [Leptolyngbya sp. FACHB-17]
MVKDMLICLGDGDNIGDVIDSCLLSEDLEKANKFSFQVKSALEDIARMAVNEMNASLIYVAGDDICFTVSSSIQIKDTLISYTNFFFRNTERTMSFGIVRIATEALIALRKAKVSGKGCVQMFGGYQD